MGSYVRHSSQEGSRKLHWPNHVLIDNNGWANAIIQPDSALSHPLRPSSLRLELVWVVLLPYVGGARVRRFGITFPQCLQTRHHLWHSMPETSAALSLWSRVGAPTRSQIVVSVVQFPRVLPSQVGHGMDSVAMNPVPIKIHQNTVRLRFSSPRIEDLQICHWTSFDPEHLKRRNSNVRSGLLELVEQC